MLEQDLKNIWKNASKSDQISIDTDQLIYELNAKMNQIQKTIKNRDRREIGSSVFGIVLFSFFAYEIPFPLTRVSCFLSILWFIYVIYRFKKSKLQHTEEQLSATLKDQLEHKKRLLEHQSKMLNSVAYWYAGPSFITNLLFIIGLGNPTDYHWSNAISEDLLPLTLQAKIITITGLFFFYLAIVWLNRKAVKKDIQPLLKNIALIEQQLNKFK